MTDRTANRIGIGLSVVVIALILLGSVASLLGFVSLGILAVSAARPDILPAAVARKNTRLILVFAVVLFLVELVATGILQGKGIL
jgi:hypothetical protein